MAEKDRKLDVAQFGILPSVEKAAEYKTIYSNSTRTSISPWDIHITFGQVVERALNANVNEDKVTIVMSPAQAKALSRNLIITIETFESTFGEIGDPMSLIAKAKAEKTKTS